MTKREKAKLRRFLDKAEKNIKAGLFYYPCDNIGCDSCPVLKVSPSGYGCHRDHNDNRLLNARKYLACIAKARAWVEKHDCQRARPGKGIEK